MYPPEERSRHIMYRVIVGTSISDKELQNFIYDENDTQVEKILHDILSCKDIDDIDRYLKKIDGMMNANIQ